MSMKDLDKNALATRETERKASKVSVKTSVGETSKRSRVASPQELAVLKLLIDKTETWSYGYELTQLLSGVEHPTVYNILIRLHKGGYLDSHWSIEAGERPRHGYKLNSQGVMYTAKRLAEASAKSKEEADCLAA